jgi:co-chaperonin GroES (HSP10)
LGKSKSKKFRFQALNDSIIAEPLEKEKEEQVTESGIQIITTEKNRDKNFFIKGRVLSVGIGKISGGARIANQVKEGDIIYYPHWPVPKYKIINLDGEKELHILNEDNVIAKEIE